MATFLFLALALVVQLSQCIKFSVGVEHDLSGPTYGLEGKSSSQVRYDDRNGLSLAGTINDILGPPIKIANGFSNMFHGSNMAGLGASLRGGGALLGFDAKMLEKVGAGNLVKGGLLLNGANAKTNAAAQAAGAKGQKIASIIEVPVKVVAMKDLAAGKVLTGLGQMKQAQAQMVDSKGQTLMNQGQLLKSQGINQIVEGTNEGVQNIGNMLQKTSENVNTAFKLLPIVWDMQQQQFQDSSKTIGQQPIQQEQQHLVSTPHQLNPGLTGGSLFGGLGSLLPGLGSGAGSSGNNFIFGANGPNHGYAALWNATNPLTNALMNPGLNPFLLPLTGGPLVQAFAAKQPIGTHESAAFASGTGPALKSLSADKNGLSFNYNLLPGIKYSEHISSNFMPSKQMGMGSAHLSKGVSKGAHPEQITQQQVQMPIVQQQQQQQQIQEAKP